MDITQTNSIFQCETLSEESFLKPLKLSHVEMLNVNKKMTAYCGEVCESVK